MKRMKSDLLKRLSKEKPEHDNDDIGEALRRGYSVRQIMKAMTPAMSETEPRQGKLRYSGQRGSFEVPYTYETFTMLCRIFLEQRTKQAEVLSLSTGESSADESNHQKIEEVISMTRFEVGKVYRGVVTRTGVTRLFEVVKRTPKFITIKGEMVCGTEKIKVQEVDGVEIGRYSCAWIHYQLKASDLESEMVSEPVSQPEETQKGRKTMTKISVSEAVNIVRTVTTAAEIQAVLEQCNKAQLHEVFLVITGMKADLCAKSWKKADIVSRYTANIVAFKAREARIAIRAAYAGITLQKTTAVEDVEVQAEREVKPDYDVAFDETAYSPDVQEVSVNVDDIPADHEPDTAPAGEPETHANTQPKPLTAEWDILHAKYVGDYTDIDVVRGKIRLGRGCVNEETIRAYEESHNQPAPAPQAQPAAVKPETISNPVVQEAKASFTIEEISACTNKEQLTALLLQAENREVLLRTFREYGLTCAGFEFCTKEKLADYLAGELMILQKVKPLHRKIRLFNRIADAVKRKSEDIALSFSAAALAGMIALLFTV